MRLIDGLLMTETRCLRGEPRTGGASAYFARRTADPQVVADLTADTFVAVITYFGSFDPRKGTARAWVFGIARSVYAVAVGTATNGTTTTSFSDGKLTSPPAPSCVSLPSPPPPGNGGGSGG
jgi:hypothetical protein